MRTVVGWVPWNCNRYRNRVTPAASRFSATPTTIWSPRSVTETNAITAPVRSPSPMPAASPRPMLPVAQAARNAA